MIKVIILTATLVLVVGLHSTDADVKECISLLHLNSRLGDLDCEGMQECAKCVLRAHGFSNPLLILDDNDVYKIEKKINDIFAFYGISCEIDYMRIIKQLQEEEIESRYQLTKPLQDYDDALTASDCVTVYINHASLTCSEYAVYMKCLIRVLNLTTLSTPLDNVYQQVSNDINDWLTRYGMHCDLDIKSLVTEVRHEQYGVGFTSFDANIQTCIKTFYWSLRSEGLNCDNLQTYVKCVFKVKGYTNLALVSDENLSRIQTRLESTLIQYGKLCDINLKSLVEELQDEDLQEGNSIIKTPADMYDIENAIYTCKDTLISSVARNEDDDCATFRKYTVCVYEEAGFSNSAPANEANLNEMTKQIESVMDEHVITCDIGTYRFLEERQEGEELQVDGGDDNKCIDSFIANVEMDGLTCDTCVSYIKCLLRETGFAHPIFATDDNLKLVKTKYESFLTKYGLFCDLDLRSLVTELQDEHIPEEYPVTETPKDAYSVDDAVYMCTNTMIASITRSEDDCDTYRIFIQCVYKKAGFSNFALATEDNVSELKNEIESAVLQFGIYCDTDVDSIIDELNEDREYNEATTVTECLSIYTSKPYLLHFSCSEFNVFVKCVLRVMQFDQIEKDVSVNIYQALQHYINKVLSIYGFQCEVDVQSLVNKIDQKGN